MLFLAIVALAHNLDLCAVWCKTEFALSPPLSLSLSLSLLFLLAMPTIDCELCQYLLLFLIL